MAKLTGRSKLLFTMLGALACTPSSAEPIGAVEPGASIPAASSQAPAEGSVAVSPTGSVSVAMTPSASTPHTMPPAGSSSAGPEPTATSSVPAADSSNDDPVEPNPPTSSSSADGEQVAPDVGADSGTGAADLPTNEGAEAALQALEAHLALPREQRPELKDEAFAQVPLDKQRSAAARQLLWEDYRTFIETTRREEFDAKVIEQGELRLRYDYTVFGDKPEAGRSLFLSLHGGGNADPSVNDEQWENQKGLYQPDEGVYLSPRAPTDTWNLWHEPHIDPMFERLIADLIVFEDVDPNRVYVMGYSAGGDGVYQLGPRMADHWAAASAMAGHPNEAQPLSLRNIGFTVHVGALDTGYDRNLVAQQWSLRMDELQGADPEGYEHLVQIHEGKEHWMDLEDAVAVPWMAEFTRDPLPKKIVWLQDDITHTRFYWLAVPSDAAVKDAVVNAELEGQAVQLELEGTDRVQVRLSDAMLDLDQPVSISVAGVERFAAVAPRTIYWLWTTLQERGDPALVFDAEVAVEL